MNTKSRAVGLRMALFLLGVTLGALAAVAWKSNPSADVRRLFSTMTPQPTQNRSARLGLPEYLVDLKVRSITRAAVLETYRPERPRFAVMPYTVREGDTAWSIAQKFDLKMESILWGNEGMSADAGSLQVDQVINILPIDGVLHTVSEQDTWESIEFRHGVSRQAVIEFLGNGLSEQVDPPPPVGQQLIIPAGTNPIVWIDPGPPVSAAGTLSPSFYTGGLVTMGTGTYILPVSPITITQPYWGGHPALDFDTVTGQPVYAADSGTVIYSGWSESGYGYLVIVDHGTGYWTYYAHNDVNLVSAGQGVLQGQQIARSGNTGNSSGDHLDFRIRIAGRNFIDPTGLLPLN